MTSTVRTGRHVLVLPTGHLLTHEMNLDRSYPCIVDDEPISPWTWRYVVYVDDRGGCFSVCETHWMKSGIVVEHV